MSDLAPLAEAVAVDPLVGHPADYHVFHQFLERCKSLPAITTSVCWPMSDVALKGAVEAASEGLIKPTLVGPEAEVTGDVSAPILAVGAGAVLEGRYAIGPAGAGQSSA